MTRGAHSAVTYQLFKQDRLEFMQVTVDMYAISNQSNGGYDQLLLRIPTWKENTEQSIAQKKDIKRE